MQKNTLTIAIPLFNEAQSISYLKKKLLLSLEKIQFETKILFVDDGSSDNTFELLNTEFSEIKNYKILQHNLNLNLGGCIKTLIDNCETEFIVFLDSDCTFDPFYISEMVTLIDDGVDIINGSPYHPNGDVDGVKKVRLFISNGANYIYRLLLNSKIYTYTSIFKLYRTSVIKNISLESYGFVAVTELFVKSILNGASVTELPCILKIRKFGDSKINILNSTINHIKFMIKLLINKVN